MKMMSNRELSQFCEQFHIILHSGISAVDGLHIMADDTEDAGAKELLTSMQADMEEYGSLSHAMKEAGIFPETMLSYVNVGEETGYLDEVMRNLSVHYQQEDEVSRQIRSAVSYPLLMLGMMCVVIVILLVRILPVFEQVFRQMGMEMTGFSSSMLAAGQVITRYSAVFLVIAVLLIGFILFLMIHPKGRALAVRIAGSLPGLRRIPYCRDYGRLTQGIAMGIRSGLTPDRSMELARELVSHPVVRTRVDKACDLLGKGELFSDSLRESSLFHGMDARLINIGFQAGSGDEVMQSLSDRYQVEAMDQISRTVAILEPTIVILLSVLVGLVLLAVITPLLGIFSEMLG